MVSVLDTRMHQIFLYMSSERGLSSVHGSIYETSQESYQNCPDISYCSASVHAFQYLTWFTKGMDQQHILSAATNHSRGGISE